MKSQKSLLASLQASQKLGVKRAYQIAELLSSFRLHGDIQADMPKVREYLAELNQRVHEFNAYTNMMDTE